MLSQGRARGQHVGSGCLRATSLCSGDGAAPAGAERSGLSVACLKCTTSAHQFHQFHQAGLSGQFCSRGRAKPPSIPSVPSIRLSLGRVFQFHILCWLQASFRDLGQNSALRSNVRAGAQAIPGAQKCLQKEPPKALRGRPASNFAGL